MKDQTKVEMGIYARKKILKYITAYIQTHGYSPSVREIGEAVGLSSSSSVQNHIQRMIKDGTLETDAPPGTPRAIRVPGYKFVKEEG